MIKNKPYYKEILFNQINSKIYKGICLSISRDLVECILTSEKPFISTANDIMYATPNKINFPVFL